MDLINSKHNPKIKLIKHVDKSDCFIVTDLNSVKKAEKLGVLKMVYTCLPIDFKVPTFRVAKGLLKTDIVAIVHYLDAKPIKSNRIVYLDEISDPTNLAKIILLMKQYGYTDLIMSPDSVNEYNPKCLEIIKDLIFDINLVHADEKILKSLKDKGYQILSTGLKSSTLLNKVKTPTKYVVVFGNEARGVKSSILKMSDVVIKIPIQNMDSLNVAVAASIVFDNL